MMTFKTNWVDQDFYNAEDLNRVESSTLLLVESLRSLYYDIPLENVVTDRTTSSIDLLSSINRVERNIKAIKDNFITPPDFGESKVWRIGMSFNYIDANRLERNLELLYIWSYIVKENLIYPGTFTCGADWEGGFY